MSLINRVFPEISRAFSLFEEPLLARRLPASFSNFPNFPTLSDQQSFFRPSVDVSETDKNYVVEAELPGMNKDDLSVEFLDDGTLMMKGKIEQASTEGSVDASSSATTESTGTSAVDGSTVSKPTFWTSERMKGHFQRSFQFPGKINPENVKASYKDGILSIIVPKVEPHGRQISIE